MDLEALRDEVEEARERAMERWARLAGGSLCRLDGPDQRRLAAKEAEGATQALSLARRLLRADGATAEILERTRKEWLTTPAGHGPDADAYRAGGLEALDRLTR